MRTFARLAGLFSILPMGGRPLGPDGIGGGDKAVVEEIDVGR